MNQENFIFHRKAESKEQSQKKAKIEQPKKLRKIPKYNKNLNTNYSGTEL